MANVLHQVIVDQWEQNRILTDLQGQGLATEAQRDHLNQHNDLLDEGCSDSSYLIISRSLESRDLKRSWAKAAFTQVGRTPLSFVAALHAAGALDAPSARQIQKHIKNAITGSVTSDERPSMDRGTVFKQFWDTVMMICGSDYLPVMLPRPAGPNNQPPAETPAELYTRRVRTAFTANFFPTFDGLLKWVAREKKTRCEHEQKLSALESKMASDKADFANRVNQIRNVNRNGNRGGNQNNNNNKTIADKDDDKGGGNKNKNKGSALDGYNDPDDPKRERSPRRDNPKDKLVCKFYVAGKKDAPCAHVAEGGSCSNGRHGGSFRRIQYLNVKENYGLSHEEARFKTTE
eukprot:g10348.t1